MIIHRVGENVGLNVDRAELHILGGVVPNSVRGVCFTFQASYMRRQARKVIELTQTDFINCIGELVKSTILEHTACPNAIPCRETVLSRQITEQALEFLYKPTYGDTSTEIPKE